VDQSSRATAIGGELRIGVVVKWNQTKKRVTEGLEALSYNTAIAALMELVNTLREANICERRIVRDLVVMLAPFAPHFAEECYQRLGGETTVFDADWPTWDANLILEPELDVVIQINGKTRSKVRVAQGASEDAVVAAALGDETVQRFIEGKEIRKQVYVKDRLLNLVVA
jgi:leucyl-tRNA synthetase